MSWMWSIAAGEIFWDNLSSLYIDNKRSFTAPTIYKFPFYWLDKNICFYSQTANICSLYVSKIIDLRHMHAYTGMDPRVWVTGDLYITFIISTRMFTMLNHASFNRHWLRHLADWHSGDTPYWDLPVIVTRQVGTGQFTHFHGI